MVFRKAQYAVSAVVMASALALFNVTAAFPTDDTTTDATQNALPFQLVTREEWGAKSPTEVTPIPPPPYVIIHHTYLPAACYTVDKCKAIMRSMQRYHQDEKGWEDIGYNFAVGSEGTVYEGRGWAKRGAHAYGYNSRSIGICLIGDWSDKLPPKEQLATTKELIAYGVHEGFIPQNYTVLGHRQVRATSCPGQALFDEIQNWPQYSPKPSRP